MNVRLITTSLLVGAIANLNACTAVKRNKSLLIDESKYCEQAIQYVYDSTYQTQTDLKAIEQITLDLSTQYSHRDLVMANALGILPLLQELASLETHPTTGNFVQRIALRQKIMGRLVVASAQIASVVAELNCEGERASRLATYLDQRDAGRIRLLTIISVVIGASTTVATTLLPDGNALKVTGIGGGALGAGFGGLGAFSSNRAVKLIHLRNLLTDVWLQNEHSSDYPPFVWNMLNDKLFSYSGQNSISYNTRRRWQEYVLMDSADKAQDLYFGGGGMYKSDDLHVRVEMLNQLQSSVLSINQDLCSLLLNFSR
ncbi:hypothetical protein [Spirosoma areae]